MNFIKYSIVVLFVAIITDVALVFAYPSPSVVAVLMDLKGNNSQNTAYKTKTINSKQYYKNYSAITWLTNPCTKCEISTRANDTIITKMGETKYFTMNSYYTGDYRLILKRNDMSALTTNHTGEWYINK